jgi:hypothetical protein
MLIFATAIAANAVGGVLYHGVGTEFGRAVHDVAIVAMLLFIATFGLARYRDRPWAAGPFLTAVAAVVVLLAVLPGAAYTVFALLGLAIGWWELGEYRQELSALRREPLTLRRLARSAVLLALLLAATAFFVGRTGAPLCRPESTMQWHAIWHALAAVAMALYAYSAIEEHPTRLEGATAARAAAAPARDPTPARETPSRTPCSRPPPRRARRDGSSVRPAPSRSEP